MKSRPKISGQIIGDNGIILAWSSGLGFGTASRGCYGCCGELPWGQCLFFPVPRPQPLVTLWQTALVPNACEHPLVSHYRPRPHQRLPCSIPDLPLPVFLHPILPILPTNHNVAQSPRTPMDGSEQSDLANHDAAFCSLSRSTALFSPLGATKPHTPLTQLCVPFLPCLTAVSGTGAVKSHQYTTLHTGSACRTSWGSLARSPGQSLSR